MQTQRSVTPRNDVVDLKDFLATLWKAGQKAIGAGGAGQVYVSRPMRVMEIARAKARRA